MGFPKNWLIKAQRNLPQDSVVHQAWRAFVPSGIRTRVGQYLATSPEYFQSLDRIGRELDNYPVSAQGEQPMRILFGPSYSIYPPSFIHDRILSYALRLRGAEIIPIYCDAVQSESCQMVTGNSPWNEDQSFERRCKYCLNQSERLWQNNPTPALRFSEYLQDDDVQEIARKVECLDSEEWVDYAEDDLLFGTWAKDNLVNSYLVGDYRLVPDYHSRGIAYLRNLLLLKVLYERIIADVKPDRVVSNDSYYGMWAILQKLCERKGIPFYSHWSGTRPGAWCYAYNDAAMNLDFSRPWKSFSQIPLSERQKSKVQKWLDGRSSGKEMVFDTASLAKHHTDSFDLSRIAPAKPTALLAANVIWDLSALNKQVVFADMIDWIAETIHWFAAHPEFQLIIKPHPGELKPSIPATEERVEVGLSKRGVHLPTNVFLLSPKVALTVYQLFPFVEVGLVHTTTVGIEMAARGMPVITTAKSPYRGFGFTIDSFSQKEYFELLERALLGEKILDLDSQVDLADKFLLFYHYHYYTKIDIMDFTYGEPLNLKVESPEDLLPGANKYLDYVSNSIMMGLPISSEDRWPPES